MQLKHSHQNTPGHYYSLLAGADSQAFMTKLIVPGLKGFMKRVYWNELEPKKGQYDFSSLLSDLTFLDAHGLRLVVMIVDKSFYDSRRCLPAGMEALEVATQSNIGPGYSALRWDPAVVTQFNALTHALGTQFDKYVAWEGIATVETSIGVPPDVTKAHSYTPEKYRDSYINILNAAVKAMPRSQVHWFMNFFQGNQDYLAAIAGAMGGKIQMGGPDILPNSASLVNGPYHLYPQFAGKVKLFGQMSNPGFAQTHPSGAYYSAAEMVAYARDQLHMSKLFWMPVSGKGFSLADAQAQFNTPLAR